MVDPYQNPNAPTTLPVDARDIAGLIIEPLVDEPYTYENMVNNPIIKPIAEVDRSLRDLEDMINKKLIDSRRHQQWVNAAIEDVPAYQDSPFVTRLINLVQSTQDVIKLQDIQIKNLKKTIKEIVQIVKQNYGVIVEEERDSYVGPEPEEIEYKEYLNNLIESGEANVSEIAKKILKIYEKDETSKNDKQRFQNSCAEVYKEEQEKSIKEIITKMIRMEVWKEVKNGRRK